MSLLIITHWDTDGVLSAACVASCLGKDNDLYVPDIGTYSLPQQEIENINSRGYEEIVITDYALQKDIVSQLEAERVVVIDHHSIKKAEGVEYYNPVADGADPEKYPCCVLAVSEYFETEFPVEVCIAAVGDQEHRIKDNEYFAPRLEQCEKKYSLDFDSLMEIKELIDSNYMTGDVKGIERTIKYIIENSVMSLRGSKILSQKIKQAASERKRLLRTNPEKRTDSIWFYDLKSHMPLLSTVTRGLSKDNPDKIIVTRLNGNVYVRRDRADVDLRCLISDGLERGWDIGGKPEVCGIVNCTAERLERVFDFLYRNNKE